MTLPIGEYRLNYRSPLGRALVASCVLHAVLLLPAPFPAVQPWLRTGDESQLQARLRRPESGTPVLAGATSSPTPPLAAPRPLPAPLPTSAGKSGNAAPTAEMAAPGEAPDADGLRAYRLALAVQARRFWRYPEAARSAGLQGTAVLRVSVLPLGTGVVSLEQSSGHVLLDEAALTMVRQALTVAVMPEVLRDRPFSTVLPVSFSRD